MRPLLGIALKLLATLVFTSMSACIKMLSANFPTGEIVFCRASVAILPLVLWLAWRGEIRHAFYTPNILGHVKRSVTGGASMFCYFAALGYLPLPDVTAIGYATPLIVVVLAALVLKETVRAYRWSAVAIGFGGVLVMLAPYLAGGALANGFPEARFGSLLVLANCVLGATALIQVRQLISAGEATGAIVFYFQVLASAFALASIALGNWRTPDLVGGLFLVAIGFLGGVGQILQTLSYRHADASLLAPFDYTGMVWALLVGWFLFGELPIPAVLAGAAIVIASGLFVIWRERRLEIDRAAAARLTRSP